MIVKKRQVKSVKMVTGETEKKKIIRGGKTGGGTKRKKARSSEMVRNKR